MTSEPFATSDDCDTLASREARVIGGAMGLPSLEVDVARENARRGLFGEPHHEPKISRFTLLHRVGSGGMGTVYAAYDPQLDRRVAVKVISESTDGPASDSDRRRMLAEARAMARVSHPNVVSVFEVGEHASGDAASVFVAMEFVAGRTLRAWVEQDRPPWSRIVAAYVAAGRGLAAVHRAGLVHRDFKPENAMIGEGDRVQVMDFGLARDTGPTETFAMTDADSGSLEGTLTKTGAIMGTPAYMAPEQLDGRGADPRSDQWAFCVALHEAIWGERPFLADTPAELATKVLSAEAAPDPPRTIVPRRIRLAIRRGLSPRPEDRWPSMDALLRELGPTRRRVTAWVGIALGSLLLAYGAFGSASHEPPCRHSEAAFGDAWDGDDASRIRDGFIALDVAFAEQAAATAERALDDYRSTWIEEHRAACEATRIHGTQSEAMLDRRMQCLSRRRREVAALVGALAEPTIETLEHTTDAIAGLVPATACADAAYVDASAEPPSDPVQAAAVEVLRDRIAEADARWETGHRFKALELARMLASESETIGYAPVQAEALVTAGRMEAQAGELASGTVLLERGYTVARQTGSARLAAEAAIEMVTVSASEGGEVASARTWLRIAEAEVAAQALDDLRWQLRDVEATLHERAGQTELAIASREQALALLSGDCPGSACAARAVLHGSLAREYSAFGRPDEALEHAAAAVDAATTGYGADHPITGSSLSQQGGVLAMLRRWDEAAVVLERAHEIRKRSLSPGHPNLVTTTVTLATVYTWGERAEQGLAMLRAAAADARRSADPYLTATTLNELGNACLRLGHVEQAEAAWTEALDLMRQMHPNGHAGMAVMLANLAMVARERGDHAAALARLEEAMQIRLAAAPDNTSNAPLYFNVANELIALDRRDEAIAKLEHAVALTEAGSLTQPGLRARVRLVEMLRPIDRERADRIYAQTKARCDALDEAGRQAATCSHLDRVAP